MKYNEAMQLPTYQITQQQGNTVSVDINFPAAHDFFNGHFEAMALLPAVAQLFTAEQIARATWGELSGFCQLKRVKFREPIFPDTGITLILTLDKKSDCTELLFRYEMDKQLKSTGILVYRTNNNE
ncbi:MAG: hypothetical protein CSA44_01800 [Gammaproteobacteria bacterium]|nr:MAG: hypothetical protein CSA44_01800 [Gammaproteobacteria bacterium]